MIPPLEVKEHLVLINADSASVNFCDLTKEVLYREDCGIEDENTYTIMTIQMPDVPVTAFYEGWGSTVEFEKSNIGSWTVTLQICSSQEDGPNCFVGIDVILNIVNPCEELTLESTDIEINIFAEQASTTRTHEWQRMYGTYDAEFKEENGQCPLEVSIDIEWLSYVSDSQSLGGTETT